MPSKKDKSTFEKEIWRLLTDHYVGLSFPKNAPDGLRASSILEVVLKAKEKAKKEILKEIDKMLHWGIYMKSEAKKIIEEHL